MKTIIIYHKADWDGFVSGAIALKANPGADTLGWNYNDVVPDLNGYDKIILTDVSLPLQEMQKYGEKMIYIDHHARAVKDNSPYVNAYYCDVDSKYSAAYLAWKYFNQFQTVPKAVRLVSAYDVFNKSGEYADWDTALQFQMGLRSVKMDLTNAMALINSDCHEILHAGQVILTVKREEAQRAFKTSAFPVNLGEGIRAYALFTHDKSSLMCESLFNDNLMDVYLMMNLFHDDKDNRMKCSVSIRVAEHCDFSGAELARTYGGGGHEKAAGFVLELEQMYSLIIVNKL